MKRVILLWPGPRNAGDDLIARGCERLLRHVLGECLIERSLLPNKDMLPEGWVKTLQPPPDILAFAGTPWLWDSFQQTQKYANGKVAVDLARSLNPACKVLFMGIGTALPLPVDEAILERKAEQEGIVEIFGNADLLACRDWRTVTAIKTAFKTLKAAAVPIALPCPSWFAYDTGNRLAWRPVAVWSDPRTDSGDAAFPDKKAEQEWFLAFSRFIYESHADVVVCTEADFKSFKSTFHQDATLLRDAAHMGSLLTGASMVLSGRVHAAVAAQQLGIPTFLMRLDTRADAFDEWGGHTGSPAKAQAWIKKDDRRTQMFAWTHKLQEVLA